MTRDTGDEPLFDSLARLAAQIAGSPIALGSLVDGAPGQLDATRRDQLAELARIVEQALALRERAPRSAGCARANSSSTAPAASRASVAGRST